MRKCKYCDNPAKVNYWGIKRIHKGYYKTCGSKVRKIFKDLPNLFKKDEKSLY